MEFLSPGNILRWSQTATSCGASLNNPQMKPVSPELHCVPRSIQLGPDSIQLGPDSIQLGPDSILHVNKVVVCSESMADIFLSLSSHTVCRMLDPNEDPSQVVDFWGKSKVRERNCSQCTELSYPNITRTHPLLTVSPFYIDIVFLCCKWEKAGRGLETRLWKEWGK